MTLQERASAIIEALKAIDRLSGDERPDTHPDYDIERIKAKLQMGWSPR